MLYEEFYFGLPFDNGFSWCGAGGSGSGSAEERDCQY
jgi:hypothetical protein